MVKCKAGKLKSPVRNSKTKVLRKCKLPKKTSAGRKADRKKVSGEFHERRHQCEKKGGKLKKGRCTKKKR